MTVTEFGYCPKCDDRKELVMTGAGVLACHSCGNLNVYDSKEKYKKLTDI